MPVLSLANALWVLTLPLFYALLAYEYAKRDQNQEFGSSCGQSALNF